MSELVWITFSRSTKEPNMNTIHWYSGNVSSSSTGNGTLCVGRDFSNVCLRSTLNSKLKWRRIYRMSTSNSKITRDSIVRSTWKRIFSWETPTMSPWRMKNKFSNSTLESFHIIGSLSMKQSKNQPVLTTQISNSNASERLILPT